MCRKFKLEQCFFDSQSSEAIGHLQLCQLACEGGELCELDSSFLLLTLFLLYYLFKSIESTNYKCQYSEDIPEMKNSTGLNFTLQPGMACLDGEGYCDSLSRCRLIEYSGPLSKILLEKESKILLVFFIEVNFMFWLLKL